MVWQSRLSEVHVCIDIDVNGRLTLISMIYSKMENNLLQSMKTWCLQAASANKPENIKAHAHPQTPNRFCALF